MNWASLSAKEWRRRPMRTGVTTAGVAIATAALFSLLSFQQGYREGVRRELDRLGAHVLLAPKGCPYDAASMALHGASWPCYLKQNYLQEVRAVPGVAAAAPAFMAALYDTGSSQTVYVGIESNMLALRASWKIEGSFPNHAGNLLAGAEAARRHGWRLGQRVRLPGLREQEGTVAGVLAATQGAEDTFVFLRLADAQEWFHHTNELTHVLVRLADPEDLDRAVGQLRGCDAGLAMNVIPLSHVFRTIQSLVASTRLLLGCIAVVALLAAGAGVSNTVLMSVVERERDIGVMRAIGSSRGQVFGLIWLEALRVCLIGAILGVAVAFLASRGVEGWVRSGLPFAPTDALIRWQWWIVGGCLSSAIMLGSFAAFVPAWRAASIPPTHAIRGGRRT